MLIRFVVSNFLSFDEETEFNMLAGNFKQHKEHVYKVGKLKVLKAAAIYGANAAGKSNLIKAIDTLQKIVEEGKINSDLENKKFKLNPENKEKPIQFEIEFSIKNKIYAYGLNINKNKIIEEWLYESGIEKDDRLIFERKLDENEKTHIKLGRQNLTQKETFLLELFEEFLLRNNEVLLGKYKQLQNKDINEVFNWFETNLYAIHSENNFFKVLHLMEKDELKDKLINEIIKGFDTGIKKIVRKRIPESDFFNIDSSLKKELYENLEEGQETVLQELTNPIIAKKENGKLVINKTVFIHIDKEGNEVEFDLKDESEGTLKLLELSPLFLSVEHDNYTFLIDEIDQSIHVNLLHELIEKIMKQKDTKGQLIFTTHESNLLDLKIFRQDEIWFAEKDRQKGSTQLYSLSEFNPRYDLDIRKGYLQGRFGAIPFLADLEKLDWSNLGVKQENQEQDKKQKND